MLVLILSNKFIFKRKGFSGYKFKGVNCVELLMDFNVALIFSTLSQTPGDNQVIDDKNEHRPTLIHHPEVIY